MELDLESTEEGVILPLQITPKARQNAVTGVHQGRLKVSITQAPEKGKANAFLVKFLSKEFDLKKSQFSLLSGETSSMKKMLIRDCSTKELQSRIENLLQ